MLRTRVTVDIFNVDAYVSIETAVLCTPDNQRKWMPRPPTKARTPHFSSFRFPCVCMPHLEQMRRTLQSLQILPSRLRLSIFGTLGKDL